MNIGRAAKDAGFKVIEGWRGKKFLKFSGGVFGNRVLWMGFDL